MGGHRWGHHNLTPGIRLLQPIKLFQTLPVPYFVISIQKRIK